MATNQPACNYKSTGNLVNRSRSLSIYRHIYQGKMVWGVNGIGCFGRCPITTMLEDKKKKGENFLDALKG